MSTTTIQIGDGQNAYVFDVPPEFSPEVTVLRNNRNERIGEHHTWPVRGYLRGAGPENINSLFSSLKTRLQTEKVNVYFKHGDTVLQQILASQAERGPTFDGPSIESGPDTCWDSNILFSFDITADLYSTQDGLIDVQYSISYRENENGSFARTKSGTVRTKLGTSALAAALAEAPAVPPNFKPVSSNVAPNDDDTEASFSFAMESLFASLPEQVLIAERLTDESVEDGVRTTTRRATFTGPGAERAADEYRPAGSVLRRSRSTSPDRNSITVTYTVQEPFAGAQRLSYRNSISIEKSVPETRIFKLEGEKNLRFQGASTEAVIRETGEVTYQGEIPPEVPPLGAAGLSLRSSSTTVSPAAKTDDGSPTAFSRTWNHTYCALSNEDVQAALPQLYQRLANPPQ